MARQAHASRGEEEPARRTPAAWAPVMQPRPERISQAIRAREEAHEDHHDDEDVENSRQSAEVH